MRVNEAGELLLCDKDGCIEKRSAGYTFCYIHGRSFFLDAKIKKAAEKSRSKALSSSARRLQASLKRVHNSEESKCII